MGRGNIGVHSRKQRRYICHVCGQTFTESKGTVFYRLRYSAEFVAQIVTLLAYGCPVQAIVAAFGLDERTVASWHSRAGKHCEEVHQHLVERPRDLGQVQADELRVKCQGGIVWMAMALQVTTRLWLGGVVRASRDHHLVTSLMEQVRRCALCRPLLFCIDGFAAYVSCIRQVFRTPVPTGQPGRPPFHAWEGVCIVQVIKQTASKRVVGVLRRVAQGTQQQVKLRQASLAASWASRTRPIVCLFWCLALLFDIASYHFVCGSRARAHNQVSSLPESTSPKSTLDAGEASE